MRAYWAPAFAGVTKIGGLMIGAVLLLAAQETVGPSDAVATEVAEAASREAAHPNAQLEVDCDNAITQMAMNACSHNDYENADRALNEAWERAADKARGSDRWAAEHNFPGGEFDRLLDAQRKWLAFRDAQCLYEIGPQEDGGTIWPLVHNGCLKKLTEVRTAQLRALIETLD